MKTTKTLLIITLLVIAGTGSISATYKIALTPQGAEFLKEFGIELLDDRFEIEYLFTIENGALPQTHMDSTGFMGGSNNDFIAELKMYNKSQHPEHNSTIEFNSAIKWYKGNEKPTPFPVSGDVVMLMTDSAVIFPAGKNSFYLIKTNPLYIEERMMVLFKVTSPFELAAIPDWGMQ